MIKGIEYEFFTLNRMSRRSGDPIFGSAMGSKKREKERKRKETAVVRNNTMFQDITRCCVTSSAGAWAMIAELPSILQALWQTEWTPPRGWPSSTPQILLVKPSKTLPRSGHKALPPEIYVTVADCFSLPQWVLDAHLLRIGSGTEPPVMRKWREPTNQREIY